MKIAENEPNKNQGISTKEEVAERLQKIIDLFEKGNRRQFAFSTGTSDGANVYFLPGGKGRKGYPGFEFLAKVIKAYPSLNAEWLLTGKGEMLKKGELSIDIKKELESRITTLETESKDWRNRFDECSQQNKKLIDKFLQ